MMNIEVENKGKSACQFDLEHKKKVWEKECLNFHDYLDRDYLLGMTLFSLFFTILQSIFIFNLYIIP